jgi:hypothetical protein
MSGEVVGVTQPRLLAVQGVTKAGIGKRRVVLEVLTTHHTINSVWERATIGHWSDCDQGWRITLTNNSVIRIDLTCESVFIMIDSK